MKQTFHSARAITEADKISPQAKKIMEVVVAAPGSKIDRDELNKALDASGALNSKQATTRVVGYYVPKLKELGVLTVEDHPEPPKPKKEKTPTPATAPAEGSAPTPPAEGAAAPVSEGKVGGKKAAK